MTPALFALSLLSPLAEVRGLEPSRAPQIDGFAGLSRLERLHASLGAHGLTIIGGRLDGVGLRNFRSGRQRQAIRWEHAPALRGDGLASRLTSLLEVR
jgi:hypothetical protein